MIRVQCLMCVFVPPVCRRGPRPAGRSARAVGARVRRMQQPRSLAGCGNRGVAHHAAQPVPALVPRQGRAY